MAEKYKSFLIPLITLLLIHNAYPEQEISPLKIGNFALPSSQQPGAFFGLGQNIIDKGDCQIGGTLIQSKGDHKNFIDLAPGLLYGVTDRLSLFFITPISLAHQPKEGIHAGFQSVITQLEYAFYKKERLRYINAATLLFNITLPTRSLNKNNPTIGSGSPSSLLGTTLSHTAIDWYYFISTGALLAISNHKTKAGNQYFFQGGFGKNIPTSPRFIAIWMIELNGILSKHDNIQGSRNPNSGSLIFYLGPTLWLSSKNLYIQAGIGLPVYQHLNGNQKKNRYLAALNMGLTL